MVSVDDHSVLAALRTLLNRVHLATPGQIPDVVAVAAGELGWSTVLYVVDYEQRHLVPVTATGERPGERLAIEGTLAGRAFEHTEPVLAQTGDPGLWVPVVDGVHRLGVLRIAVPPGTDLQDPAVEDAYRLLTQLTGHMMAAKAPYGDALAQWSRTRPRSPASELLWELLPPLTMGCEGLVVSGIVEPCYDVAADVFDYSVVDDVAHLAVMDATGHDLRGTVLSAVALAGLRNSRREQRTLEETVRTTNTLVTEMADGQRFVTGVFARLDLRTGRLRYVNAGHPAPLLLRRGKVVKELDGGRCALLGLGDLDVTGAAEERLEPGDSVVLYTDGITEARDAHRTFFGLHRLVEHLELSAAAGLKAPETLRRLCHAVLEHQGGVLQDDATLILAQWASGDEHEYTSGIALAPHPLDDDAPRR